MAQVLNIGTGVQVKVEDNGVVVVRFDGTADQGPSKSGKTRIVATTNGNVTLPNGVTIGLNAYRKG